MLGIREWRCGFGEMAVTTGFPEAVGSTGCTSNNFITVSQIEEHVDATDSPHKSMQQIKSECSQRPHNRSRCENEYLKRWCCAVEIELVRVVYERRDGFKINGHSCRVGKELEC